jgi:cobalamin biosynthesis protein CobD/CbiB
MKKLLLWVAGIFKDETGNPSSKRIVGVMCALALCLTMYHNSFSTVDVAPAPYLVDAVALLAFGCLGLSSVDKFTNTKKDIKDALKQEDKPEA